MNSSNLFRLVSVAMCDGPLRSLVSVPPKTGVCARSAHLARSAPANTGRMRQATMITILALWMLLVGDPAKPAAPDRKQIDEDAVAYINAHSDKEDMVMIPMRDGVRLYSLIVFPKGQARQNLPTVL